jgi:cytochrome c oxidase subunit III
MNANTHSSGPKKFSGPSLLSRDPLTGPQIGMLIAIGSWAMLFGTFVLSLLLARARVKIWPPIGSEAVPYLVPTIAVGVALFSSFVYHQAYVRIKEKSDLYGFRQGLWITILLGFMFLALQTVTWFQLRDLDFRVEKGLFDSIVYSLIGFHALHVIGGMGSLIWILKNSYFPGQKILPNYNSANCLGPQLVGWFWHFLGLVWVIFYGLLVWL